VIASDLPARVSHSIRELALLAPGDRVIVALSGGADSTALLRLLACLPDLPLDLVAAHLNHRLRGAESDADEEFARRLATQLEIPFECRRIDIKAVASEKGLNLEDAGRRERSAFFDELRRQRRAAAIALAHHADDQAETVLMRLLRGSGMTGLSGMAHLNGRGYVRPLLGIGRAEIEAYLSGIGQDWREDSSNRDVAFLRNRIRHELLPLLEQYNPAIRRRLAVTAGLLAEEESLLEQLAAQAVAEAWQPVSGGMACSIQRLQAQPLPIRRRMVRQVLAKLAGTLERFSHRHIQAVLALADSTHPNACLTLPQGIGALREYGVLLLKQGGRSPENRDELVVDGPGCHRLPGGGVLSVELSAAAPDFRTIAPDTAFFDLDRAPFPWLVRGFRPGDRIRPLGMAGQKKVKQLFIDGKVPFDQRRRTPLLFSGGELIWVVGLRRSQLSAIDATSTRIVKVCVATPPALY
jgi:tRNA(Ile)-lysidine synthase